LACYLKLQPLFESIGQIHVVKAMSSYQHNQEHLSWATSHQDATEIVTEKERC
jgi:hypothetical protein